MEPVFTFWEGRMPAYIALCMKAWTFPYVCLNFDNVIKTYGTLVAGKLRRFTLPQIADYVRVHILRDNGGYWLDADTISITGELPKGNIMGYPEYRSATIGLLHTKEHTAMYELWAKYQDKVLENVDSDPRRWDIMGNAFLDKYLLKHQNVVIEPIKSYWPELYKLQSGLSRVEKYRKFYFEQQFGVKDIQATPLLMLHNSWTPQWYKDLTTDNVLNRNCTMSNILREVL